MLDTPLCIWRLYVRHLDVAGIRRFTIFWLDDAYLSQLSTLKAVEKLSLRNFNAHAADLSRLLSVFGGVNEFHLTHGFFKSFWELMRLMMLFPLKRLTLEENRYYLPNSLDMIPTPPVEWTRNVRTVHLRSLLHREIADLGGFLRALGPSLTHLYLARPQFLRYPCSDCACRCN
jgi:hypothetical protein